MFRIIVEILVFLRIHRYRGSYKVVFVVNTYMRMATFWIVFFASHAMRNQI